MDRDLAEDVEVVMGKADAGWSDASTLHVGEPVSDRVTAGTRRVYPVWIAGRADARITFDVVATATAGGDVRVAVLGPLDHGTRAVLGAGGYGSPRGDVEISADATQTGAYLVVVGSYALATATSYDLDVHCEDCDAARVDVLAQPKAGALVATANGRVVQAVLGDALAARSFDVEMDVLASAPGRPETAHVVASATASGNQINAILPASVAAGDDLRLVIRAAAGDVLDTGVGTRFAPVAEAFVRTDAVLYSDLAGVQTSGVAGFFEGSAEISLRSEDRHLELAAASVVGRRPGQAGNGLGAFDAVLAPEELAAANVPHDGELVSVGVIGGGTGDYARLGCFEYCNNLSGLETCTGGPRPCPSAGW